MDLPPSPDPFDRLHDSLLLHLLNLVSDIKALGRCTLVCKRFHSLVPLVETVTVKVDCVISGDDHGLSVRGRGILSQLCRLVVGSIAKPLQVLLHMLGPKKEIFTTASMTHHSPGEVLKNFRAIRSLRIELPAGELGVEDGILLKWKAEFGSTLQSFVILGAAGLIKPPEVESPKKDAQPVLGRSWFLQQKDGTMVGSGSVNDDGAETVRCQQQSQGHGQEDNGSIPESFYTNGGLKLRVVWTISSLIAASARHYLLQQIICEHPTLQNLILTDMDGQGLLSMGKEQLQEFRLKPLATSASANRTQVPALNMKLWYAPYLELPGGTGLKGATLVAIKPNDQPVQKEVDGFVSNAFEEPYRSAVNMLSKRRTYLLEMNSF